MATQARSIDHAQIAALRQRVRDRSLVDSDDFVLIDDLLGLASELAVAIASKRASLARLRRLVFGPSSDKRPTGSAATPPSPVESSPTKSSEDVSDPPEDAPHSEPARGHGRRPASAYPGARRVPCTNALRSGDRCPQCYGRGRLYDTDSPSVFIKMTGRPLVEATAYEREVLRCGACLQRFYAPLPPGVTTERWDATADVALAVAKYCSGAIRSPETGLLPGDWRRRPHGL